MPEVDPWIWLWALGCFAVGACGICRIRLHGTSPSSGHGLGLLAFALLIGGMVVAMLYRPDGLAPQGLAAGLLVAGMLWEHPDVPERIAQET